jgi:hypothetical protein
MDNLDQQMMDDISYLSFLSNLVDLGVVMTAGANPDLHDAAVIAAGCTVLRAMDRLDRLRAASIRGLM